MADERRDDRRARGDHTTEGRMTGEGGYPKSTQNPPQSEGMRPADQPDPKLRVPDDEPDAPDTVHSEESHYQPADPTRPVRSGTPRGD